MTKNDQRFTDPGSPPSGVTATAIVRVKYPDGKQSIFSFDEFYMLGCNNGRLESFIHCNPVELIVGMEGMIRLIEWAAWNGQFDEYSWQEVAKRIDSLEETIKNLKG